MTDHESDSDFTPSRFASEMQLRTRKEKKFDEVEADLPGVTLQQTQRFSIDALRSRLSGLSRFNPFSKAIARGDIVWLLDNTAFRPSRMGSWQAEFVTAVFEQEPKHKMVDLVAGIARTLGLADDAEEKRTIEERLGPFVWDIQVARAVVVMQAGSRKQLKLGATGTGGCSSDVVKISGHSKGSFIKANAVVTGGVSGLLEMQTFYAGPDGWAIISDIDDTIKITTTSDPVGILRETFINQPRPIPGMPELYADLKSYLPKDSPWFYLSASPYNLYPFLREFRDRHYPPGTMILRDSNWMTIAGLLSALTMGTEEYKVDRMKKVNTWFPKKKLIVFGDSTQSDPEAYGEIYRTFPGWIRLILIRKAQDTAMFGLSEKNEPERFERAFKGIPKEAWHVFEEPTECMPIIKAVMSKA